MTHKRGRMIYFYCLKVDCLFVDSIIRLDYRPATLYQYHHILYSKQWFGILLNKAGIIRLSLYACTSSHRYNGRWCLLFPRFGRPSGLSVVCGHKNLRTMSTPTVPLAHLLSFPHDYHTAMIQASDLTYFYSLQPSSSQFPRDEEGVERAFWQSTPTALEELREGTEDESNRTGAFLSRPLQLRTTFSPVIP